MIKIVKCVATKVDKENRNGSQYNGTAPPAYGSGAAPWTSCIITYTSESE